MNFPWWTATGGTTPTPNDDHRNGEGIQEFDFNNLHTAQDNAYDNNDNDDFSLTGATAKGNRERGPPNLIMRWQRGCHKDYRPPNK